MIEEVSQAEKIRRVQFALQYVEERWDGISSTKEMLEIYDILHGTYEIPILTAHQVFNICRQMGTGSLGVVKKYGQYQFKVFNHCGQPIKGKRFDGAKRVTFLSHDIEVKVVAGNDKTYEDLRWVWGSPPSIEDLILLKISAPHGI